MKKLSVITICYNEPNLEKTCESIVNQTWQDFEWIVIDGKSNDDTQKIFDKYKQRIDKFVSEPDNGIYNAYNKGLELAEGEWVHFLNVGDSHYSKDVLGKIFSKELDTDILYGEQFEIYNNPKIKNRVSVQPDKIDNKFFINRCIQTSAAFVRRELFDKYGNFNEQYKIVSDLEKWIQFCQNNARFKHTDIVVSNFDKSGISSDVKHAQLRVKEELQLLKQHYSEDEIAAEYYRYKKYSFMEQIFSIINSRDHTHKIITILGIRIKIKRHK